MKHSDIKNLIKYMGYKAQDGEKQIFFKIYPNQNNYIINVNFETEKIEYGSEIRLGDLTTSNFENSENFVVFECIDRLLTKGYPPSCLELESKIQLGKREKGKLDILVYDQSDEPFIMIECKTWGAEFEKEKKKMILNGGQLFSYYASKRAPQYLCLYTSVLEENNIRYRNDIVRVDPHWKELNDQKEIHDHWNKNFKDNGIFDKWAKTYGVEIKSLTRGRLKELSSDDSGRIYNQFAEILRHNVVSDKPNAFNKILNLFICKIIDENKSDDEEVDFQWFENDTNVELQGRLNELYKKGMKRFLDIEVTDYSEKDITDKLINVHEENVKQQIQKMFEELRLQKNPEFAFKEVYNTQSFLDNAIVVKEIVELLQPYQFRYGHKQQFLGDFFELLLNTSIKQEAGQFFTPVPIAKFIISSLPIKEIIEKKIKNDESEILPIAIDYAAGSGHFLTEWMDELQKVIDKINITGIRRDAANKLKYWKQGEFEWASDTVYGIEADYRLVKTTKVSSFLNGDGEAVIIRANGLDNFKKSTDFKEKLKITSKDDDKDNAQFDIVIANPPYSVAAFKNTLQYGEETFNLYNKLTDDSSEIECLFIERAKQLLKIGGYAGIILPSSILNNTGIYSETRELLLKYFYIKAIVEFGPNTFMATSTNTVVLFLERRDNIDYKKISVEINNFFDNPKDRTVNGIEKTFTKYVHSIFNNIELEDYISFINCKENVKVKEERIYKEYVSWFNNLNEIKLLKEKKTFKEKSIYEQQDELNKLFYEKVFEKEKEKILFFFLVYSQKTMVIKTNIGQGISKNERKNEAEKEFLGYEFSKRRGYEGIKIYRDSNGKLLTKLFDEENKHNPTKANHYIYNAYLNKYDDIADNIKDNIEVFDTVELIDFQKVVFEKSLSLYAKKKDIKSKWKMVNIEDISIQIINGGTPLKNKREYWDKSDIPWATLKDFSEQNIFLDNTQKAVTQQALNENKVKIIPKNSVLLSCTATIGKVSINKIELTTNQQINSIICDINKIEPEYLAYYLKYNGYKLADLTNNPGVKHVNLEILKKYQIPLPTKTVQMDIINGINRITEVEQTSIQKKLELQKNIYEIINNLSLIGDEWDYLGEYYEINRKTHDPRKYPDKEYIYVDINSVENGKGRIDYSKKIIGEQAPSRARRIAPKNSIILSTVRPNLKGIARIKEDKPNCIFSTGFAVLEAKDDMKASNDMLYYLLMYSDYLMEQMINSMPKGQYPSINTKDIQHFRIYIGDKQKEIVSEIKEIEEQIENLEFLIGNADKERESIINKYL